MVLALSEAIRFSVVTVGTGRSSENLGESNKSEEEVHGLDDDGSHLV